MVKKKKRGQFNYQLLFARPGLTNEMITGANTSVGGQEEGAAGVTTVIKED